MRHWIRRRRGKASFRSEVRPTDVFLVGHPKSGNTWLAYMLAILLVKDTKHQVTVANVGEYVPFIHGHDLRLGEYGHLPDPRIMRNECPIYPEFYPKVVYLVRDPRAVLVSFYHMYRIMLNDTHITLKSFIEQYLSTKGLFKEWNRGLVRWDRQVLSWTQEAQQNTRILIVKYEDLVADRLRVLEAVVEFVGIPCDEEHLSLAVERGSFEAMRSNEEEYGAEAYPDEIGRRGRFMRRGKVDGWPQEMDESLARVLNNEFGAAMKAHGYV
jgi:hypothetical protein